LLELQEYRLVDIQCSMKASIDTVCLCPLNDIPYSTTDFSFSIHIGNSEVHLDDLCAANPILKTRIDTILNEKIYPLVRATIGQESDNHIPPQGSLCVYDSILVRYNGEKARAAGRVGASQPLVSRP